MRIVVWTVYCLWNGIYAPCVPITTYSQQACETQLAFMQEVGTVHFNEGVKPMCWPEPPYKER